MRSPLVYCGPMWGGKTEALISRLIRAKLQGIKVIAFTPELNKRTKNNLIETHSGACFPAIKVKDGQELLEKAISLDDNNSWGEDSTRHTVNNSNDINPANVIALDDDEFGKY